MWIRWPYQMVPIGGLNNYPLCFQHRGRRFKHPDPLHFTLEFSRAMIHLVMPLIASQEGVISSQEGVITSQEGVAHHHCH